MASHSPLANQRVVPPEDGARDGVAVEVGVDGAQQAEVGRAGGVAQHKGVHLQQ